MNKPSLRCKIIGCTAVPLKRPNSIFFHREWVMGVEYSAYFKQSSALDLLPFFPFLCMPTSCFCFVVGNTNINNTYTLWYHLRPKRILLNSQLSTPLRKNIAVLIPCPKEPLLLSSLLPIGHFSLYVTGKLRTWLQGPKPWL